MWSRASQHQIMHCSYSLAAGTFPSWTSCHQQFGTNGRLNFVVTSVELMPSSLVGVMMPYEVNSAFRKLLWFCCLQRLVLIMLHQALKNYAEGHRCPRRSCACWAIAVPDGQRRLLCSAIEERGRRTAIHGTLLSAIVEAQLAGTRNL